ncbi:hypothetical protein [Endozoicomonas lisbonensis]|uniref:Uncharacterized protein n=1 Tax=Endozoicomonas lisbonensis TaxID=3120522 RepID=A0ABV2SP29_9GAMM
MAKDHNINLDELHNLLYDSAPIDDILCAYNKVTAQREKNGIRLKETQKEIAVLEAEAKWLRDSNAEFPDSVDDHVERQIGRIVIAQSSRSGINNFI